MKVFVVGGDNVYANFLKGATLVSSVKEADLILFTGGADVTPALYGCQPHSSTYADPDRDKIEVDIFNEIDPANQVCLGICRGSQFLCVMNGGKLVQNCSGHAMGRTHEISNGKECYQITSTHHQMQYPYELDDTDYDLLYIASPRRSNKYEGYSINARNILSKGEPEIVMYHKEGKPKCLAVQGHPEMIPDSPVAKMISNLVNNMIKDIKK